MPAWRGPRRRTRRPARYDTCPYDVRYDGQGRSDLDRLGYRDPSGQGWWRPDGLPDLLALGHPDLLLGSVRRRLVRVRDRAVEARDFSAA